MTSATATLEIPGYKAGTWVVDTAHSGVTFRVRHMMMSKVRGSFAINEVTIDAPENPLEVRITGSADAAGIDTKDKGRDDHLKSADFFDVENHPTIDFVTTGVRAEDDRLYADGELTIRGTTKPVTFEIDFGGFGSDPWGNYKAGLTATTVINREDFGLTWNAALETGGVLVGKDVTIEIDLQGVLQA